MGNLCEGEPLSLEVGMGNRGVFQGFPFLLYVLPQGILNYDVFAYVFKN